MAVVNITVQPGSPQVIDPRALGLDVPIGITMTPGGGGTCGIESSRTDTAVSNPGGARWLASQSGTVSVATELSLLAPVVALRLTATTAAANFEMVSA